MDKDEEDEEDEITAAFVPAMAEAVAADTAATTSSLIEGYRVVTLLDRRILLDLDRIPLNSRDNSFEFAEFDNLGDDPS